MGEGAQGLKLLVKQMKLLGRTGDQIIDDVGKIWAASLVEDPEHGLVCRYNLAGEFEVWGSPLAPKDNLIWLGQEKELTLTYPADPSFWNRATPPLPPWTDPPDPQIVTGIVT